MRNLHDPPPKSNAEFAWPPPPPPRFPAPPQHFSNEHSLMYIHLHVYTPVPFLNIICCISHADVRAKSEQFLHAMM